MTDNLLPGTFDATNLVCPLCLEVAKAPILETICGHYFCQTCFDRQRQHEPVLQCATCRTRLSGDGVRRSFGAERIISNWNAKCPQGECKWRGSFGGLPNHINQCEWTIIKCPNNGCETMLLRAILKDHQ